MRAGRAWSTGRADSAERAGRNRPPSVTVRAVRSLAAVPMLAGLVAGCGGDDERAGCAWMEEQTAERDAGAVVVLVDGSASVRGRTSGAKGVDYTKAVGDLLTQKDEQGKEVKEAFTVSIGTFGGPSGDVDWTVDNLSADWRRSNPHPKNQEGNLQEANKCLTADLATAQAKAPSDAGTDVLSALSSGAERLRDVEGERRLLILSDGLSTTGCADLRGARVGSREEITSIASVCAAPAEFGELPELGGMKNMSISFVGLGHSAAGQPSATGPQRTWLRELWTTLCERAGASPSGCTADTADVGTVTSAPKGSGTAPDDPVIPYTDGLTRTIRLTGSALFDTGSAQVRDEALEMLRTVAAQARTTSGLDQVVVNGYVDPRGGTSNDRSLSQSRAEAVAEVLVDHGVPASRIRAEGRGRSPGCPGETATQDMSRAQRLQCDRRVDVQIIRK